MIQIPVTNQPNQAFRMTIPIAEGNISVEFFIYWNRQANYWQMNLTDNLSGNKVVTGQPLLVGENLLRQMAYANIGQAYVVPITDSAQGNPSLGDWDVNYILVWQ